MKLQLIRNGTLRVEYAQKTFVIDPYLAEKHAHPSCAGISPNPMVALPIPAEQVIADIDMVIISHLHSDHYDAKAQQLLPKRLKVFCQPGDDAELEDQGFINVTPVSGEIEWEGIKITRTTGQHGTGKVLAEMGKVSGFIFEAADEPTVYWAGDTILCGPVSRIITEIQPEIIITHSGGAVWDDDVPIIMDAEQTVAVCRMAPNSIVIATHLESEDHTTVSRKDLREFAEANRISAEQLLIPADGEMLTF